MGKARNGEDGQGLAWLGRARQRMARQSKARSDCGPEIQSYRDFFTLAKSEEILKGVL